ncbi:hypothetical protein DNTS_008624 [Danionella cerebrum]|uniref:Fibronectin type-III domain-containing protein n=1 Tax=Danionella cerebrum TaxID=2873325 RepID=A0A553QT08_9TELE|nr:hypothetical protein DNTS_008624 [Danionella translucida]
MLFRMISYLCFTAILMLINFDWTSGLNPPRDVKIVKSELQWKPPDENNVRYSIQYKLVNKSEGEWQTLFNNTGQSFKFSDGFYRAVFRVRTERGSNFSEWVYSPQVKCVNVNSCAPVVNLSMTSGIASLTIAHMDNSLEKEHGGHLEFKISSWKVENGVNSELDSRLTDSKHEIFNDLESGQHCFQVQYLLYNKPYGRPSELRCAVNPETPDEIRRRVFLCSILGTFLLLTLGVFHVQRISYANMSKFQQSKFAVI